VNSTVIVAIIGAAASIIAASLSFWLTKRAERQDALQQRKLEHYHELLSAISDLAVDGADKDQANQNFARAANTIALVAHPRVIAALMAFHDEVKFSNPTRTTEGHDRKLKELLLAIRKSLDLPFKDDPATFDFHLIGSRPTKQQA
jgi:proline dehydrogenase